MYDNALLLYNEANVHFPWVNVVHTQIECIDCKSATCNILHSFSYSGAGLLPLFVMVVLLPGEKMALNIFEPRYRLLIRRTMEGNRRFGMAQV